MINAVVLVCHVALANCNQWTAERHAVVSVPRTYCLPAAMQYAAQNMAVEIGEIVMVKCREDSA